MPTPPSPRFPTIAFAPKWARPAALCLGLAALAGAARARPETAQETVVECAGASEMISTDTETVATFHEHVVVIGNNIKLYCDDLKVIATRKGDPKATLGKYGNFKSLVAVGHVRILQTDREATCGRAEVFPGEDRIVLSDHPSVRSASDDYVASGPRMVLYRGQRRAVIESSPGERTRISLPAMKDMGFDVGSPTSPGAGTPAAGAGK